MANVEVNGAGIRELLTSTEVRNDIERRANAVARAARGAGIMVEGEPGDLPLPITVAVRRGPNRAGATVAIAHPSGLAVEAKHGLLGRALDAAR